MSSFRYEGVKEIDLLSLPNQEYDVHSGLLSALWTIDVALLWLSFDGTFELDLEGCYRAMRALAASTRLSKSSPTDFSRRMTSFHLVKSSSPLSLGTTNVKLSSPPYATSSNFR